MRGMLLILLFAAILIFALWLIRSQGRSQLEQNVSSQERAMEELTRVNLNNLERVVEAFVGQEGRVPANLEELRKSRLLTAPVVDAWGREIRYEARDEMSFRLLSSGRDGIFGTPDDIERRR